MYVCMYVCVCMCVFGPLLGLYFGFRPLLGLYVGFRPILGLYVGFRPLLSPELKIYICKLSVSFSQASQMPWRLASAGNSHTTVWTRGGGGGHLELPIFLLVGINIYIYIAVIMQHAPNHATISTLNKSAALAAVRSTAAKPPQQLNTDDQ